MIPAPLPPAPACLQQAGAALHGRYAGRLARFDWGEHLAQRSRLWRWWHHKRWHYVGLGDEALFIGVAIVDVGWTATAFAYLFDRCERRLLADWSQDGLPGLQCRVGEAPLAGADVRFRSPSAQLSLRQAEGETLQLSVAVRGLRIEARLNLAGMAAPLLAVGPIAVGLSHATQKTSALPVSGWAEAGGRRFALDGASAAIDASNGLLARHTAWRWASAHAPGLGFNLQQGYFGTQENVLWLDGQPIGLGAASFEFDPTAPLKPWRIHTDDGLLDLVFTPEGARSENRNLLIAASRYVQPIGTFSGWVRASKTTTPRQVQNLLGVTEDHHSKW